MPKRGTADDLKLGWAARVTGYHTDAHEILLSPTMQELEWHVLGPDHDPQHTPPPPSFHPTPRPDAN